MNVTSLTFLALCLPFLGALAAPMLTRMFGHGAAWVLALIPAAIFVHFSGFAAKVSQGRAVAGGYSWVPSLDVRLSFLVDGLSLTFLLLISGIGALIVLYAGGYLKGHPHQGRFLSFLLMFMGAMLGLVASDSFLMLFVFWELTSITSFLLIGFDHQREEARRAAFQALVVTGGGGLFLLAGLLVLWSIAGVTEFSALSSLGPVVQASPLYLAVLVLVLGGAFTKSAQFPFHFWLPNAMEAPTPVSAYLHSATMVKAGVYLLMRLNPVLGGTPEWQLILPVFGSITLIIGALLAVRQTDLKLMLAYTTMSVARPSCHAHRLRIALCHRGGGAVSGRPFTVQGCAVHGGGDHRPRDRNARRHPSRRPAHRHAADLCHCACRRHLDGRAAALLRLPRQGGGLCRAVVF